MDIRYGKGLEEIIWNIFTITDAIFHFSVVSFLAILYKFILFLPILLCINISERVLALEILIIR